MKKTKILLCNDASFLDTGYGIYGKEILSRLHKNEEYEVAELGCFVDHLNTRIKDIPWRFYANAVPVNDERYNTYKSNNLNQFGLWRFNRVLADFNPDIVFDVRDYWMSAYQETSPYRRFYNWVIMPTVDSAPQRIDWKITFKNSDLVVPYTQWAKDTLIQECGDTINLFPQIANAGVDYNIFKPIYNKDEHKTKYLGTNKINVIGTVMRNQKRKLLADLILVLNEFIKNPSNSTNTVLYLHTSYPEEAGWDIPSLLLEYGVADRVYFTYLCKSCNSFFPSKFNGITTKCTSCGSYNARFTSTTNSVSTSQLSEIYNLFDVYLQYAICEGFGIPQIEAASCGIPIMVVDYSAMSEIADNLLGYKIPCSLFREMESNALRALPDNNYTINLLTQFFNKTITIPNSDHIREKCIEKYSWDNVYQTWNAAFDHIKNNQKTNWDTSEKYTTNHTNVSIPSTISKKEFVEFMCSHVINEPYLINTAPIQMLIKDFINSVIVQNGHFKTFGHQDVIAILESFLNNKIVCEQMRTNKNSIAKEDFIP